MNNPNMKLRKTIPFITSKNKILRNKFNKVEDMYTEKLENITEINEETQKSGKIYCTH